MGCAGRYTIEWQLLRTWFWRFGFQKYKQFV